MENNGNNSLWRKGVALRTTIVVELKLSEADEERLNKIFAEFLKELRKKEEQAHVE